LVVIGGIQEMIDIFGKIIPEELNNRIIKI
jgi:hypothetical protein